MSIFHIERADGTSRRVGGYKHKPQPGARQFEASLATEDLPPAVDLRPHLTPVEDQGDTNSCTANATAGAFEYLLKLHTGQDLDVSRMFIYFNARKLESDAIADEGSAIADSVEGLKKFGVCPEDTWPFDPKHVNKHPPHHAYDEAHKEVVDELEQVPTDLDQWRHCLAEGRPIIFGMKLFDSFDKARKGKVPMPTDSEKARNKHGRHAMLCVGYSDVDRLFIVRNSWGGTWGDRGYCYIPYDYLMNDEYNSGDSWVIRHVDGVAEPDRSTWGDDTSILPEFDDTELHRMDDDAYQVMLDAMGSVHLESRVALLFMVAAGIDGDVSADELAALNDEVQRMLAALGSDLSAHAVVRFARKHVDDESLIEESVALLGAHLSNELLASLLASMRAVAGGDDLGDEEAEFLDTITEVWEIDVDDAAEGDGSEEDADDSDDEDADDSDDEDGDDDDDDDETDDEDDGS